MYGMSFDCSHQNWFLAKILKLSVLFWILPSLVGACWCSRLFLASRVRGVFQIDVPIYFIFRSYFRYYRNFRTIWAQQSSCSVLDYCRQQWLRWIGRTFAAASQKHQTTSLHAISLSNGTKKQRYESVFVAILLQSNVSMLIITIYYTSFNRTCGPIYRTLCGHHTLQHTTAWIWSVCVLSLKVT